MRASIIFYNKAGKKKIYVVHKQSVSASLLKTGQVTLDPINDDIFTNGRGGTPHFSPSRPNPVTINKLFTHNFLSFDQVGSQVI